MLEPAQRESEHGTKLGQAEGGVGREAIRRVRGQGGGGGAPGDEVAAEKGEAVTEGKESSSDDAPACTGRAGVEVAWRGVEEGNETKDGRLPATADDSDVEVGKEEAGTETREEGIGEEGKKESGQEEEDVEEHEEEAEREATEEQDGGRVKELTGGIGRRGLIMAGLPWFLSRN